MGYEPGAYIGGSTNIAGFFLHSIVESVNNLHPFNLTFFTGDGLEMRLIKYCFYLNIHHMITVYGGFQVNFEEICAQRLFLVRLIRKRTWLFLSFRMWFYVFWGYLAHVVLTWTTQVCIKLLTHNIFIY